VTTDDRIDHARRNTGPIRNGPDRGDQPAPESFTNLLELAAEFEGRQDRSGDQPSTPVPHAALPAPPWIASARPPRAVVAPIPERAVTAIWGGLAAFLVLLAGVLWVQGDELARAVWRGSSSSPESTAAATADATRPTTSSPEAPAGVDAQGRDPGNPTDPPVSDPSVPLGSTSGGEEACGRVDEWIDARPPQFADAAVLSTRCSGAYAVVELADNDGATLDGAGTIFVTLRDTESGWAVLATTSETDCVALKQVDPGIPTSLCT